MKALFRFVLFVFAAFLLAAVTAKAVRRTAGERCEDPCVSREIYG